MRAIGIILRIGITLLALAFVVDAISSWSELAGFQTFVLGFIAGTGTSLGVVYGILRHKNKPKTTGKTFLSGEYL